MISGGSATSDTFIGSGSIPSAEYITLPRPQLQTQQSATRPKVLTQSSSQSFRDRVTPQMIEEAQREADQRAAATAAMPPPVKREGRSPSPEKKGGFFRSTLRAASGKDSRLAPSLRPGQPAAPASKAATVAWPAAHSSEMPPPSSSSQASRQQSMDIPRAEQPVASNIGKKHAYSRQPDSPNEDVRRTASMDVPVRPRSNEPTMREYGGGPRGPAVDAYVRRSQDLSRPTSNTMPPPPKPSANTNVGSSRLPASAPTSPPLPQLQYRSEYGSESLDQRNVNMLKSRQARMNLDASKSAPAASSSQGQSPSKLRQALRMVPRKAVGTGPSPQPTAPAVYAKPAGKPPAKEQIPPSSQSAPRSTGEAQQAKKMVRAKAPASAPAAVPAAIKKEPVLASTPPPEEASDDERPATTEWDKKVKYLMKHLPKGVDEQAAKSILNEIVVKGDEVHWDDIAGLDIAKNALKEAVVYPFLRPDLFMGLREPARGMLLFGPPGTGKTMLARAVATESKSTFFAISASSLTSKYLGESEKLVRALFSLAKSLTPAIIFVDEIDSLLSSRSGASEHEATRRIKTEFLIQWSDLASAAAGKQQTEGDASRVLVLAATNLPWAIDEAARRRFVRRQYIPLPEPHVRESQLRKLMTHQRHNLRDRDYKRLVVLTDGKLSPCSTIYGLNLTTTQASPAQT